MELRVSRIDCGFVGQSSGLSGPLGLVAFPFRINVSLNGSLWNYLARFPPLSAASQCALADCPAASLSGSRVEAALGAIQTDLFDSARPNVAHGDGLSVNCPRMMQRRAFPFEISNGRPLRKCRLAISKNEVEGGRPMPRFGRGMAGNRPTREEWKGGRCSHHSHLSSQSPTGLRSSKPMPGILVQISETCNDL
jgi:hypothetical protein